VRRDESVVEGVGKGKKFKVNVKKVDGEWAAVVVIDGKRDEGKTYYAGDDKQDAIGSAKAMKADARKHGYTVVEANDDKTFKAEAKKMKEKGYRYIILFPGNKPEPLYAKSMHQAVDVIKDHGGPKNVKAQSIDSFLNENDDETDDLPASDEKAIKALAKKMGAIKVTGKGPSVNATFDDRGSATAFFKEVSKKHKKAKPVMRRSGDTEFTVHVDEAVDETATPPSAKLDNAPVIAKGTAGTPVNYVVVDGKVWSSPQAGSSGQRAVLYGTEEAFREKVKKGRFRARLVKEDEEFPEGCVAIGDGRYYFEGELYASFEDLPTDESFRKELDELLTEDNRASARSKK
jgi:hypothetical protein